MRGLEESRLHILKRSTKIAEAIEDNKVITQSIVPVKALEQTLLKASF